VFESTYAYTLENAKKHSIAHGIKTLEHLHGATPFVVSFVSSTALGGHFVPLDQGALASLYLAGIEKFNACDYYESHEVWEELWTEYRGPSRQFYQGLIQAAVALYHFGNGNIRGARKLHGSVHRYLEPYAPRHLGLDVTSFLGSFDPCLAEVAASLQQGDEIVAMIVPVAPAARFGRKRGAAMASQVRGPDPQGPGQGCQQGAVGQGVKAVGMDEDQVDRPLRIAEVEQAHPALAPTVRHRQAQSTGRGEPDRIHGAEIVFASGDCQRAGAGAQTTGTPGSDRGPRWWCGR
jgi:hypothetical protein